MDEAVKDGKPFFIWWNSSRMHTITARWSIRGRTAAPRLLDRRRQPGRAALRRHQDHLPAPELHGHAGLEDAVRGTALPDDDPPAHDPFERAVDEAPDYNRWAGEHVFFFAPATEYVTQWIASFRDFPQCAKQGTFGIDQVIEKMTATPGGGKH